MSMISTNNRNEETNDDGPIHIKRFSKNGSGKKDASLRTKDSRQRAKESIDRYCQEQIMLHTRNKEGSFNGT